MQILLRNAESHQWGMYSLGCQARGSWAWARGGIFGEMASSVLSEPHGNAAGRNLCQCSLAHAGIFITKLWSQAQGWRWGGLLAVPCFISTLFWTEGEALWPSPTDSKHKCTVQVFQHPLASLWSLPGGFWKSPWVLGECFFRLTHQDRETVFSHSK